MIFAKDFARNYEKMIILGTSDTCYILDFIHVTRNKTFMKKGFLCFL